MSENYPATGTEGLGLDETELPGQPVAAPSAQPQPAAPRAVRPAATATRERSSATVQPAGAAGAARNGATGSHEIQPGTNQSVSTWEKEAVIELQGLSKAFGSFKVLDGVTCRIPKGEITVLMGPSGTGKSVTLRHVVGLLNPDRGDIVVEGKHVPQLNEKQLLELRRSIGMLFQDGALFSSMNLYDNVAFPLRQHTKLPEPKVREIVMQPL